LPSKVEIFGDDDARDTCLDIQDSLGSKQAL